MVKIKVVKVINKTDKFEKSYIKTGEPYGGIKVTSREIAQEAVDVYKGSFEKAEKITPELLKKLDLRSQLKSL